MRIREELKTRALVLMIEINSGTDVGRTALGRHSDSEKS
jgi:hypothetical protein